MEKTKISNLKLEKAFAPLSKEKSHSKPKNEHLSISEKEENIKLKEEISQPVSATEKELIEDLPHDTQEEVAEIQSQINVIQAEALKKIEALGEGGKEGWYEHSETGEKYFVQTFDHPNIVSSIYLGTQIYEMLGYSVQGAELVVFDEQSGEYGLAFHEVPGEKELTQGELIGNKEVYEGWVVDQVLGNYPGIEYEPAGFCLDGGGKIVRKMTKGAFADIDGNLGNKYWHESFDYWSTADKESKSSYEEIIQKLTEIRNVLQSEDFTNKINELENEDIIGHSFRIHLEHSLESRIDRFDEVIGRLNDYIKARDERLAIEKEKLALEMDIFRSVPDISKEKFTPSQNLETISQLMERLESMKAELTETPFAPKASFLADRDHIESQQIDVIEDEKAGKYLVRLKLTQENYQKMLENTSPNDLDGNIKYGDQEGFDVLSLPAWEYVFKYKGEMIRGLLGKEGQRSAEGLLQIELPISIDNQKLKPEEVDQIITVILEGLTKEKGIVEAPDKESEVAYMEARYLWHHKLVDGDEAATVMLQEAMGRMQRESVFPEIGYSTIVEKGKHLEYEQKYGRYFVYHRVYSVGNLVSIIKAGGLLSTHERYSRGGIISGMSSTEDIEKGGADSVFTRILPEESGSTDRFEQINLIFDNSILDRTDWYAYGHDRFGNTAPSYFKNRLGPDALFEEQIRSYNGGNEQMFRTGIPMSAVKMIVAGDEVSRTNVLEKLREAGIEEINGVPIEDFVIYKGRKKEMFTLSDGRPKFYPRRTGREIAVTEEKELEGLKINTYLKMKSQAVKDNLRLHEVQSLCLVGFTAEGDAVVLKDDKTCFTLTPIEAKNDFEFSEEVVDAQPPEEEIEETESFGEKFMTVSGIEVHATEDKEINGLKVGSLLKPRENAWMSEKTKAAKKIQIVGFTQEPKVIYQLDGGECQVTEFGYIKESFDITETSGAKQYYMYDNPGFPIEITDIKEMHGIKVGTILTKKEFGNDVGEGSYYDKISKAQKVEVVGFKGNGEIVIQLDGGGCETDSFTGIKEDFEIPGKNSEKESTDKKFYGLMTGNELELSKKQVLDGIVVGSMVIVKEGREKYIKDTILNKINPFTSLEVVGFTNNDKVVIQLNGEGCFTSETYTFKENYEIVS